MNSPKSIEHNNTNRKKYSAIFSMLEANYKTLLDTPDPSELIGFPKIELKSKSYKPYSDFFDEKTLDLKTPETGFCDILQEARSFFEYEDLDKKIWHIYDLKSAAKWHVIYMYYSFFILNNNLLRSSYYENFSSDQSFNAYFEIKIKNTLEDKWIISKKELFIETNDIINSIWLEFNENIFDKNNLDIIQKYKKNNILTKELDNFLDLITMYIFVWIIFSNYLSRSKELNDDEKIKWIFFCVLIYKISQKIKEKQEDVIHLFDKNNILKELWQNYTIKDLNIFEESFYVKNYFIELAKKPETYPILEDINFMRLLIDNKDIFLWKKDIKYKRLLDLILEIKNPNTLLKVKEILFWLKSLKLKEDFLINSVEILIKSNNILDTLDIKLFLKYISRGFKLEDLIKIWEKTLKIIDSNSNAVNIIKESIKDPEYIYKLEKEEYINSLKKDFIYINEYSEGFLEIKNIIEKSNEYSLNDLKVHILEIKLKYNLDEVIEFNKKILKNIKESEVSDYLNLLYKLSIYFNDFKNKDKILEKIFTKNKEFVEFVSFLIEHIDINSDITEINEKTFISYFEILEQNKFYIKDFLNTNDKKYDILFLLNQIKTIEVENDLNTKLNDLFWDESMELLNTYIDNSSDKNLTKILIINIWKLLPESMFEDFVLNIETLKLNDLKNLEKIINLTKYYKLDIKDFEIYLNIFQKYSDKKYNYLLDNLNNSILNQIENKTEFLDVLLNFFNYWNEDIIQKYIKSFNKKNDFIIYENDLDNRVNNIYLNWNLKEKENLVFKINQILETLAFVIHPKHTTSTRNNNFWKWSWSYSEVLHNYIIRKLKKHSNEGINDYLFRILNTDIPTLIDVKANDINWYFELWSLVDIWNKYKSKIWLFNILEIVNLIINDITNLWERIDLTKVWILYKKTLSSAIFKN